MESYYNQDIIFLKSRNDGLWEKNATLGFAAYMGIYLVFLFAYIELTTLLDILYKQNARNGNGRTDDK